MRAHQSRLDQLLADPLVRQLMASDGVAEADIRRLAERVASRRPDLGAAAFRGRANVACAAFAA